MLNRNESYKGNGRSEFPPTLLEPLTAFTRSGPGNHLTYSPLSHRRKPVDRPAANDGKRRTGNGRKNGTVVESLSIWPEVANLLKVEQYDQAVELLLKAQFAAPPGGPESKAAFLVMVRQICQAYYQQQAEITRHQQALEAANRQVRELSQHLYAMVTRPDEYLKSGQWREAGGSWAVSRAPRLNQEQMEQTSDSLQVCCLGPFEVYLNNGLISEWNSLKACSIFKYLVTHPDLPTSSDTLMDVFWPNADPERARHNLHQAIHNLRKTLKQGRDLQPVLFENDGYFLNPELDLWLDYIEFEKQVHWGRRLEKAGSLTEAVAAYRSAAEFYRADFLVEDRYEEWSYLQREYLRRVYLELVDQLSEIYLQHGQLSETVAYCQKLIGQDNCHEAAHQRLMRCYLLRGQRHLAIRQYQLCVETLKTELDVPPSPATQLLYEKIVGA